MNLLPANTHDLVQRTDALIGIGERLLQAYEEPLTEEWWNNLDEEIQKLLFAHVRLWKEKGVLLTREFLKENNSFHLPKDIYYIYKSYFKEDIQITLCKDFLKELSVLTVLHLQSTKLSNYTLLKKLKKITSLNLEYNNITDISFLQDLKKLTILDLGCNNITDISALKGLNSLFFLDLSWNKITDISFLKGLKKMKLLSLAINRITDITALSSLTNLTLLLIDANRITNIIDLSKLKNLIVLSLTNNQVKNVSLYFLNVLSNLKELYLYDNPIENIPEETFKKQDKNVLLEVRTYLESK